MNQEKPKPAYYGILPASVRYNKSLHPMARLLYSEITALCQKEGYCWASNSYFADLFDVTDRSVINWINNLRDEKYIRTELIYKNGSKEIRERRIYISDPILVQNIQNIDPNGGEKKFTTPPENSDTDPTEKIFTAPPEKKFRGGEKKFTDNNKPLSLKSSSSLKIIENLEKFAEEDEEFKKIISDLEKRKKCAFEWLDHNKNAWDKVKGEGASLRRWAKVWIGKPENRVVDKLSITKDPIKEKIKKALQGKADSFAYDVYFYDAEVKDGVVFVKDKLALRYEDILKTINLKIEVKK